MWLRGRKERKKAIWPLREEKNCRVSQIYLGKKRCWKCSLSELMSFSLHSVCVSSLPFFIRRLAPSLPYIGTQETYCAQTKSFRQFRVGRRKSKASKQPYHYRRRRFAGSSSSRNEIGSLSISKQARSLPFCHFACLPLDSFLCNSFHFLKGW